MLHYEKAVESKRRSGQRRIEVFSPTIERRLTLFSRDSHDAWLLLEGLGAEKTWRETGGAWTATLYCCAPWCRRHAAPLVLDVAARSGEGAEETSPIELTFLERNLLAHLMRFESQIRGA
jgi:hypothetical protein